VARFTVKIKDKITKGKFAPLEADLDSIDFGSRSECSVTFDDPIAADRHCEVRWEGGQFSIEDCGSVIGTFVNGSEVIERVPLRDLDEIVMGITRFMVAIEGEGADQTLTLSGEIGGFSYAEGDLDRWVRDEVTFGREPAVRAGNWFMVFALLLLIPLVFSDAVEEPLLDPGPLNQHHARLFDLDLEMLTGRDLECAQLAQDQGCMVCHDSFNRTPMEKCAQCHDSFMTEQHPFRTSAIDDPGLSDRGFFEHDCLICHVDHRGDEDVRPAFIPRAAGIKQSCATCHNWEEPPPPSRELMVPELSHLREISFNTFPHDKHLAPASGDAIACEVCHLIPEQGAAFPEDGARDFGSVQFETCMACHDRETSERDPALAKHWEGMDADLAYRVDWHGTDDPQGEADNCLQCHTTLLEEELAWVETQQPEQLSWALERRLHSEQFKAHPQIKDSRSCSDCHLDGAPMFGGTVTTARFWHEVHMEVLVPPSSDSFAAATVISALCEQCHFEMVSEAYPPSQHLSSPLYEGADLSSCSICHTRSFGDPESLIRGLGEMELPEATRRVDFPHALHIGTGHEDLALGCFACHSFTDGAKDGGHFSALPTTRADAANCQSCHVADVGESRVAHANVAGGDCIKCHLEGDPSFGGPVVQKPWPPSARFNHFSEGHGEATRAGNCAECHQGTETASNVLQVPVPTEALKACRDCHLQERYHWR